MKNKINIPVRQYFGLLRTYLKPQWKQMLLLALLLVVSITLQLINPQIIRSFIDSAVSGEVSMKMLLMLAVMFTVIALVNQVITVSASYVGESVGWKATNTMRSDLAAHCLHLDASFHKEHTSGEMIERIDGDINALSNFFSNFIVIFVSNLALLAGVLLLLFKEDWRIGLGMTIFVAFAIFLMHRIRTIAAPYWVKVSKVRAGFYSFLGEHLAGTEDTRANGATKYVMLGFYDRLRNWLPIQRRASMAGFSMWMSSLFVFALGNAMVLILGGYLWSVGAITVGTIYMIFFYTELLNRPIEQIRTQIDDLQRADASIMRVTELFNINSKIKDGTIDTIPEGAMAVQFNDVSFGYGDRDDERVLRAIDFTLEKNKVLGLLGRTGSGKTSLVRLLMRFYDANEGTILLDNIPIQDMTLKALRQRIGMVTQDIQLFEASVRDNLTFYDRSINDDQIIEVLYEIGMGQWLAQLPNGLDTEMSSEGNGLSAGESQLLAFARVFLKDPGLVILDEASSRLDPATEQLMERAITKLLKGRTAIIIAHRLSTIQRTDQIMILEHGKIVEYGEREKLALDRQSYYASLMTTGMEEQLA